MESQRAACRDALNMASTGRLKNVDRKTPEQEIARIIRKASKESEKEKGPRVALDILSMLMPFDAERLKLIADIFVAMHPFASSTQDNQPARKLTRGERLNLVRMRLGMDPDPAYLKNSALGQRRLAHQAATEAAQQTAPKSPRHHRRKRPNNVVAIKPNASGRFRRGSESGFLND